MMSILHQARFSPLDLLVLFLFAVLHPAGAVPNSRLLPGLNTQSLTSTNVYVHATPSLPVHLHHANRSARSRVRSRRSRKLHVAADPANANVPAFRSPSRSLRSLGHPTGSVAAETPLPPLYQYTADPALDEHLLVPSARPIVCNNRTEFECICMLPGVTSASTPPSPVANSSNPLSGVAECSKYIKTDDLPVVDIRMRNINTEALLYTGQSYEEYFKKRIASIVSHYCQHNSNECPGTTLRMKQVRQASVDELGVDDVLYAADESEPLLSQTNVVLLRMEQQRGNVTRLLFVITKNDRNDGLLDEFGTIDPVKIKYILASQVGPLSRVLGGIRIESVRAAYLRRNAGYAVAAAVGVDRRRDNQRDNTTLMRILFAVGAFFGITYLIGFYQCIKYYHGKWQRKRRESKEGLAATADGRNYGTCESKRRPSRNGHANHVGIASIDERVPLTYVEIDENANPTHGITRSNNHNNNEEVVLSERAARNLFMCDASQLPREPTIDDNFAFLPVNADVVVTPQPTIDEVSNSSLGSRSRVASDATGAPVASEPSVDAFFPPSGAFTTYVDEQYNKSRVSPDKDKDTSKPPPKPAREPLQSSTAPPPMVMLQSSSFREDTPDIPVATTAAEIEDLRHLQQQVYDEAKNQLGSGMDSPPLDRPRSRRGSRIDEPEGLLDLRELKPLHSDDPLAEPMDVPVSIPVPELDPEDRWSSSEEGDVDVYYKMSDDDDAADDVDAADDGITKEEVEWKRALAKANRVAAKQKHRHGHGHKDKERRQQRDDAPSIDIHSPSSAEMPIFDDSAPPKKVVTPPSSPTEDRHQDSDSDVDDGDVPTTTTATAKELEPDAEGFVYERLREELSPQPPIVVDLDTADLDLAPYTGKQMPPPLQLAPNHENGGGFGAVVLDSPPESNSDRTFAPAMSCNSSDDEGSLR